MSEKKKEGPIYYKFTRPVEEKLGSLRSLEERTKKTEDLLERYSNIQKVILLVLVLAFISVAYNVITLQINTYGGYANSIESLRQDVRDAQYDALLERINYLEKVQELQADEIQRLQDLNQSTLNQTA